MRKNGLPRKSDGTEPRTMSEEESVRRAVFAQAAAEEAAKPPKTRKSWGLFAYGDNPAGIGGGIG